MFRRFRLPAMFMVGLTLPLSAHAQYTVQIFSSAGLGSLTSAYGGQVGGYWQNHALIWNGSIASQIDLHPPGFQGSVLYAMGAGQQVGEVGNGTITHGALWGGTAASFVDLHPDGFNNSYLRGTDGLHQVGRADGHAGIWSGTAASFVDLNPVGSAFSEALAVQGNKQLGRANVPSTVNRHAYLWSGDPNTGIDLNPAGFYETWGQAIDGDDQVGYGYGEVYTNMAAIVWHGSATNYTVLNPPGITGCLAAAAAGGKQIGRSGINGELHASLWSGTAESFVDLHTFLPAGYTSSQASAIDPVTGDIVGFADIGIQVRSVIIWRPVPEPASLIALALGVAGLAGRRRSPRG
jgi:hypothetical protein